MIATANDHVKVPLTIRFIDPAQSLKIGRELRIEVTRADGAGERVPIDHLDFGFTPLAWGEVRPGAEPGLGIVRVIAIAKTVDIYDRPKYGLTATFKARGDAAVETVNRFVLAMGAPVVELRFFLRDEDSVDEFNPQQQRAPLSAGDFEVTPPGSAEVMVEADRVRVRVLWADVVPKLAVRFPNGERATLDLDLTQAGKEPGMDPVPVASPAPAPAAVRESYAAPAPAAAPVSVPLPDPPPAPFAAVPPPAPAATAGVARPAGVDPSASLRREVQQVRREIDAALADGAIPPGKREKLLKKVDFMRGVVQAYKGPDVAALRDFFQRTLGEIVLAG